MKKFIVASLVGLMLLGLTGCDAEGAEIAGNLYDASEYCVISDSKTEIYQRTF